MVNMVVVLIVLLIAAVVVGGIYLVIFLLAKKEFKNKKNTVVSICEKCGTALVAGKKFCINCGAEIGAAEEQKKR